MDDLIERLGVWLREWQSDVDRDWRRAPSSEEAARLIMAAIEDTGYVIVAKEPTPAMLAAVADIPMIAASIWKDMLDAAQPPTRDDA